MSKRVANKKGEHQGARSGRLRLGYWRLQRARARHTANLTAIRQAEAEARKAAVQHKAKKHGVLHYLTSAVKKLRNQGRRRHA